MAQFVTELVIFKDMPDRIGPPSEPGSLPFLPPFTEDGPYTHRNTTGVCDDKTLLDRFNDIATTVKENANMEGVLVAIQFVPYEVVCLVHPLVNSEDFPEGVVMDSTGAIGLDLLTDPTRRFYGATVVKSKEIIIIGPLALKECQDGKDCDSLVERAIIAALPVVSEDHIIEIDGKEYPRWGSVEVIINWNALIERSGIFERFAEQGKAFRLTRTDRIIDQETNEETLDVAVLAETPDFDPVNLETVTTKLDTTNNEWEMTIAYEATYDKWSGWATAVTVLLSFSLAAMTFTIMVQKHNYQRIKKQYQEDLAHPQTLRLRLFLDDNVGEEVTPEVEAQILNSKPIADYFVHATVLFGGRFLNRHDGASFARFLTIFLLV
jgi:hypothetical protein